MGFREARVKAPLPAVEKVSTTWTHQSVASLEKEPLHHTLDGTMRRPLHLKPSHEKVQKVRAANQLPEGAAEGAPEGASQGGSQLERKDFTPTAGDAKQHMAEVRTMVLYR